MLIIGTAAHPPQWFCKPCNKHSGLLSNKSGDEHLDDITFELLCETPSGEIAIDRVLRWMSSEDIEVLGASFSFLHKPEHYTRVVPGISFPQYHSFHLLYFERCLKENPDGEWSDSRYLAAHSLVSWFLGLWKDESIPRDALSDLKGLLAKLYKEGDAPLRRCVITGALEHLFLNKEVRKFFSDWKTSPELAEAYEDALHH